MSINRSEVRKSALTLLYAIRENGDNAAEFNYNLFWTIAQEKKTDHLREAHAKVVLHTCRNSADSARLLTERMEQLELAMHGDLTSAILREEATRFTERNNAFESALTALSYSLTDKRREDTEQLALCTRDTLQLAHALVGMGNDLLPRFADFPMYRRVCDTFAAVVRRRIRLMEATDALAEPANLADSKEHSGLARIAADLIELRPAAEELVRNTLAHREELETLLASLLDNYSPERLDMVDNCILLLALYELRCAALEPAIVISEANMLANAYSGSKSAPFIHGILAAAAKA